MRFERAPPPNPALALLLTNRQLHSETRSLLSSRPLCRPLRYTLDVAYLQDCTLWPTWLSVPQRASHVDELNVQFRVFNCPADMWMMEKPSRGMFHIGNGAPEAIVWVFYHLIYIALAYGPCGRPITVGRLVLDFLPTDEEDIIPLGVSRHRRRRLSDLTNPRDFFRLWRVDNRPNPVFDPTDFKTHAAAAMMCFVERELDMLLGIGADMFRYGRIIYENIGEIEYRVAGKAQGEAGVAWQLAHTAMWGMNATSFSRQSWYAKFCPWLPKVQERRRKLGMPVISSSAEGAPADGDENEGSEA